MDVQPPIAQAPISNTSPQTQCDMGICRFGLGWVGGGSVTLGGFTVLTSLTPNPKPHNPKTLKLSETPNTDHGYGYIIMCVTPR